MTMLPFLAGNPPILDLTAHALITAMAVRPSGRRAALIQSTILALKNTTATEGGSLWDRMGLFYVTAAHDRQAAKLNWVNPAIGPLTEVNTVGFLPDRGFTGDGMGSYLDTGILQTNIANYGMDSAHAGGWAVTAGSTARALLGVNGVAYISANQGGAERAVRMNATTTFTTDDNVTTGHVVGVRRDSGNHYSYRNGGSEAIAARNSVALVSSTATLLAYGGVTLFSDAQIGMAHFGNQLSATDIAGLYTIMRTYMTGVGVS